MAKKSPKIIDPTFSPKDMEPPIKREKKKLTTEKYPPDRGSDRDFLFRTFHDMRNPLHAIMGYASLVLRKTREQIPEKHQENLEKVIKSAEQLNEIVDRMVSLYREK
ncbi:MAG TPA: histidine kinase dimerization/phospho-acceptor domain-containing protein [Thermodesulfobacteriota bacterium]|nr:histidine kinase dimerization/phospho-acceptor domain-containing protein [Thermodesulfobacteriota bacterium]